jgi:hypothetical protein
MAPLEAKKCVGGGVVKFMIVVTLDNFDGAAKLCENRGKKIGQSGKSVRFHVQRKGSHKMRAIIKDN